MSSSQDKTERRLPRRHGYLDRVFNENLSSLRAVARAVVILTGFALTKTMKTLRLFRFRVARRLYSEIYFLGKRMTDHDKTRLINSLVRPTGTVVDVGAAFGFFASYASRRVGSQGRVICFEPDPECVIFLNDLRSTRCEFNNIEIHQQGLWSTPTTLALHKCDENPGENSLFESPVHARTETVSLLPLDDAMPADITPDLIKMDIQGAEWHALQGMKRTLARMKSGALIVECSPTDLAMAGKNMTDLLDTLFGAGFRVFRLGDRDPVEVHSSSDLADLNHRALAQCDLLCTKSSEDG